MAETEKPESTEPITIDEERHWRERILEELHHLNRSLEKIADRLTGINIS